MKFIVILFIIGSAAVCPAQSFERLSVQSSSKTLWVELSSLNRLELRHNGSSNLVTLQYNNHQSYPEPTMIEKRELVEIKAIQNKEILPQAQQNKYRAGQPLYPNYILEVPMGWQVKISYKQGNSLINTFTGDLELYLDHGTIDLEGINGVAKIQSYGGVINCRLTNVKISIESKEGTVATQIQDANLKVSKRSITGQYGSAKNKVQIKTILGKVILSRSVEE